ncbi:MAG TPA: 16S rRNA (uracil(1498)-N(3))-methyltransferase [Burkholderiales bacterium]|nr:16S rRNA (uracil(1498)-N(3))-methyltransferase [Burkholderiales bacterium]
MREPRFFHPELLCVGIETRMSESAGHHAAHVLRLKPGDHVTLFDGEGKDYLSRILSLSKSGVYIITETCSIPDRESPVMMELAQGISAADKMDFTLQKAVELGVVKIVPLLTQRCLSKLDVEKATRRVSHWRQVVVSACEQCGRSIVPKVAPIESLDSYLKTSSEEGVKFMLSPRSDHGFSSFLAPNNLSLLVGPEGGLTETEEQKALRSGFVAVKLGPRILRTETAALAALSAINALWGDF